MSEFVFGISASGSAIVVNQTGAPIDFPVRCLINRGLPPKGRKRVRVEIDLSRLLPLPAAEYLDVFGIRCNAESIQHEVLTVDVEGQTLLLPALVLLRAFLRPHALLFERAFSFSGVGSAIALSADGQSTMMYSSFPNIVRAINQSVLNMMWWLLASPSAQRMQGELAFNAARYGAIRFTPPVGKLTCIVFGELTATGAIAVTELTPTLLKELDVQTPSPKNELVLHSSMDFHGGGTGLADSCAYPVKAHKSGSFALIDSEWEFVKPLLLDAGFRDGASDDKRAWVDALFAKVGGGLTWKKVCPAEMKAPTMPNFFRRLCETGKMNQLCALTSARASVC